jgi:pantoate--beta-alanine ligase
MEIVKNAARMQAIARRLRSEGRRIALVPTTGGLHEGQLSLVRRARELSHVVVVSVVSPLPETIRLEKLETTKELRPSERPRYLSSDVERLVPIGVDYVFAPPVEDIFSETSSTEVVVKRLSEKLHGTSHAEHFTLMTTVLTILLNVVRPDWVLFGLRDAQQVAIIRQLVRDLRFDVEICLCPIVREADGLAVASDNELLGERDRKAAAALYQALEKAQVLVAAGERDTASLVKVMREVIESHPPIKIEYVSIVDSETLEPLATIADRSALVTVAGFIGKVRLSDNLILSV